MLTEYKNLAIAILNEIEKYEAKPTKASSARIRKLSLRVGKLGAMFRQYMLRLDKGK
jgi:hypothetical protein